MAAADKRATLRLALTGILTGMSMGDWCLPEPQTPPQFLGWGMSPAGTQIPGAAQAHDSDIGIRPK